MTQNIRLAANVNAEGIITYINKDYQDWTGYRLEELVGKSIMTLRAPDFPSIIQKTISEQMRKHQPIQFPIVEQKKNGERYWADMAIQPIFQAGEYVGYTSVKRIMTDAKRIAQSENFLKTSNLANSPTPMVFGLAPASAWPMATLANPLAVSMNLR